MPRNGSGQYNPLTNTWNPPVTGVLATGADFQAQLNDISAAITQSVSKDGQTPMTANLPMGNNSIVGIASGTETSPSISANGDTNTGLYFPAADTVGVAVGGVQALLIDSTGIEVPAGTAAAPSLTTTGDTNTGLYFPAADTVAIATGGVKRVEVDANGNVGVGITPSAWGGVYKGFQIGQGGLMSRTGGSDVYLLGNNYYDGTNFRYINNSSASQYAQNLGTHAWYTAPSGTAGNPITFTQAMTLDTSGNLLVGASSGTGHNLWKNAPSSYTAWLYNTGTTAGTRVLDLAMATNGDATGRFIDCGDAGAFRMRVLGNGNLQNFNNSYGAISDAKLKENITDATPKLGKINQVRIVNFNMIGDTQKQIGVIAQELEQVFPSMIEEMPDRDDEGNDLGTVTKSVKYSVFVPILIKAIQEQQALIESQKTAIELLTARIAALEAK